MNIINLEEYGIYSNTKADYTFKIYQLLSKCRNLKDVTLKFQKGRYDFWGDKAWEKLYFMSNHDEDALKRSIFPIVGFDNLTIDGQGSEFIFHGLMTPFIIENSSNITIKNINIDWEDFLIVQGEAVSVRENAVDIKIDEKYNCEVKNGKLIGKGYNLRYEVWGVNEFDVDTLAPAYKSSDSCLEDEFCKVSFEKKDENIYTMKGDFKREPKIGNLFVFRCGPRANASFFAKDSENIFINSVNVYYAPGMGFIAQKCTDIKLDKFNVMIKPESNRAFTAFADATHFVNCKGQVTVSNCLFENQLDDALNVHGIYTIIEDILSDDCIMVKLIHNMQKGVDIFMLGDKIGFINRSNLLTYANSSIKSAEKINSDYILLTLNEKLPQDVKKGDAVENTTWNPDLTLTNCIIRNNRARGILITTPKKVVIENNSFSNAGAAIKISGDANYWFESGAVKDVTIKKNVFGDCNYCPGPWGKAVIDIDPEILELRDSNECYHKNINIIENTFKTFDKGIVSARSVDGLRFENNIIEQTNNYPKHNAMKDAIETTSCKNVKVK